ncbi:hypothetical protein EYB26_003749 [Talaromyces marneffei]|uniref:uncharacterized protein n=1 Tax=Talaromyces marneffei TaxID=37727 RepID=UPI0012A81ED6|nr:uncharacterized protein EYB26_003746 [Talaromyces marneffei]XP_054119018.1 uncharacterized protein EYB26_003749 [Talaromyces marneffei]QGA16079.1 hypothetical protein EYB26_003746 [Talaromyces marneffei]QGA16082.1 hypothetical protein EYB26_003749 [Talaromyces marneffei]
MPAGRPPSDIDQYKEEISSSFLNGQSVSNITKILSDKYQITVHSQTIRRRLQQWGVSRTNHESKELEDKIKELYFQHGLRDRQIIHALEKNGIKISQSTLTTIQRRLGLHRRVVNPEDIQNINDLVRAEVQKQLNSGRIEGYGRGYLYRFFRLKGYNIARDRLYSIVQELDPDGLTKSLLFIFRDYFLKLSNDGYFKKNSLADRIAILAIYMPMAREEIASYINVWNTHGIRKQSHRINSINGQPNVLYHLSEDGIQDYGSKPDQVVLQTLLDEHNFELNEYLPLDTLNWC